MTATRACTADPRAPARTGTRHRSPTARSRGTNTIAAVFGYSIYNEAAVAFTDATGHAHVLILGGGNVATGTATAGVVHC